MTEGFLICREVICVIAIGLSLGKMEIYLICFLDYVENRKK